MRSRRLIGYAVAALLLALAAAGALIFSRPDVYRTKERRQAKSAMVEAINADLASRMPPDRPPDEEWKNERVIFCEDGSWLSYRSRCHKQDPKVYDLFIAKASDGNWYYSTYHFCVGALVLDQSGQPTTLGDFKVQYSLAEFDGRSDTALGKTWPTRQ